jgi:hypothetical protein
MVIAYNDLLNNYDLCIIGSGPAGIILALEYSRLNPGKSLLLLEYGDQNLKIKNSLDDSIVLTNTVNHHTPYEATNKGFGGTSQTWGGRCVNYNPIDFCEREIIDGNCTWSEDTNKQIQKYLDISARYFECGEAAFSINQIPAFKNTRIAEGFVEGIVTDSQIERWSMPTRFANRYADDISKASNIALLQGFEARSFSKVNEPGKASILSIRNIHTKELLNVKADKFIIAAGAQESTRLLLRNTQLFSNLEQVPAALGKYYQGHLSGKIASVKFYGSPEKTDFGFMRDGEGVYLRRRFQFTDAFLKKSNLLNTAIWLDNPLYYDPAHGSGAMSFMYLAMIMPIIGKKLAPPAIAQSVTKGKVTGIGRHLLNVFKQLPGSVFKPVSIFYKRYLLTRKLPGVFLYSPDNNYALHFHAEQMPDEKNSMRLDTDGETLIIDYSLNDDDINSVIKLHKVLDKYLRDLKCGELTYWFKEEDLYDAIKQMSKDGIHQSGTTRMAASAAKGVVDEDLKVWGTDNVYICSSSVFPTSSQANPTFLLGAFAARLAAYLTNMND